MSKHNKYLKQKLHAKKNQKLSGKTLTDESLEAISGGGASLYGYSNSPSKGTNSKGQIIGLADGTK